MKIMNYIIAVLSLTTSVFYASDHGVLKGAAHRDHLRENYFVAYTLFKQECDYTQNKRTLLFGTYSNQQMVCEELFDYLNKKDAELAKYNASYGYHDLEMFRTAYSKK